MSHHVMKVTVLIHKFSHRVHVGEAVILQASVFALRTH